MAKLFYTLLTIATGWIPLGMTFISPATNPHAVVIVFSPFIVAIVIAVIAGIWGYLGD